MISIDRHRGDTELLEVGTSPCAKRNVFGSRGRAILSAILTLAGPPAAVNAQVDSPAARQREDALRRLREAAERVSTPSRMNQDERYPSASDQVSSDYVDFGTMPYNVGTPLHRAQWNLQCQGKQHPRGSVMEGVCTNLMRAAQLSAAVDELKGSGSLQSPRQRGQIPSTLSPGVTNSPKASFVSVDPDDYVGFGYVSPQAGTAEQRVHWQMRCETMRYRRGSPGEIFCSDLLRALKDGDASVPFAASNGSRSVGSAPKMSYPAQPVTAPKRGGSVNAGRQCRPVNPITGQECVRQIKTSSDKSYDGSIVHRVHFENSCNITASIQALAVSRQPDDWRGNGISPGAKSEITCVQYADGRANSCSGFTRYRVSSSQCR